MRRVRLFVRFIAILVLLPTFPALTAARAGDLPTATVTRSDVIRVIEVPGTLRPQAGALVRVGSRVGGALTELRVEVGDAVNKGDILAVIDDREILDEMAAARARLAAALVQAERVGAVAGARVEEAAKVRDGARAEAAYAAERLGRLAALRQAAGISADQLEAARRDARVAAGRASGRAEAARAADGERLAAVARAVAEAEAARAELDRLAVLHDETRVKSPISGLVAKVAVKAGETVVARLQTVELVTIVDPTRLEMAALIHEEHLEAVRPGLPLRFSLPGRPDREFEAVIDRVEAFPAARDGLVYYTAAAPLDPGAAVHARPDMTAACRVLLAARRGVTSVPNAALHEEGGLRVAYRLEADGAAARVVPVLGAAGPESTEVVSGLEPGDRLALVRPGM